MYCTSMTEAAVSASAFDLIFAFDEVVALGYRESVNLSQIRTYVSHGERTLPEVLRGGVDEECFEWRG